MVSAAGLWATSGEAGVHVGWRDGVRLGVLISLLVILAMIVAGKVAIGAVFLSLE